MIGDMSENHTALWSDNQRAEFKKIVALMITDFRYFYRKNSLQASLLFRPDKDKPSFI